MSKGCGRQPINRHHARILLLCDENQANGAMKDEVDCPGPEAGYSHGPRVRRRGVEEGLEAALVAQATTQPASEETGRCRGGSPDRPDLLPTAGGPGRLDPATAAGPTG